MRPVVGNSTIVRHGIKAVIVEGVDIVMEAILRHNRCSETSGG